MAENNVQAMVQTLRSSCDDNKKQLDAELEEHVHWLRESVRLNKKRLLPSVDDAEDGPSAKKRPAIKVGRFSCARLAFRLASAAAGTHHSLLRRWLSCTNSTVP